MQKLELYKNKWLSDLEAWQIAVYNQLLRLEKDCKNNLLNIDFDRLLDGTNKLLDIMPHKSKKTWLDVRTLQQALLKWNVKGGINQKVFVDACLSATKKDKPDWIIKHKPDEIENIIDKSIIVKEKRLKELDITEKNIKLDSEYTKLLELKKQYKKIYWEALLEKIKRLENKLKYKYTLIE